MKLDVPYYSQKSSKVVERFGYAGSGISSLQMVLNFYESNCSIDDLAETIQESGIFWDYNTGWIHAGLINVAHKYNLDGIRINFSQLADEDLLRAKEVLAEEGASPKEIEKFQNLFQLAKEKTPLQVVESLLEENIPVIASVTEDFTDTPATLLTVIVGYDADNFFIHDPWKFGASYSINKESFKKVWTNRIIVLYSK